jgi:hypothetical protein
MELFRNGLKLSVTKGLDESQGSANVPVTLAHDSSDEYADYTEQIHMKYSANGKVYKEILPCGNNVYTIHSKAMANVGSLELAVHLIKGTTELVTNQVTLEVKEAPNAVSMVDPGEHNWQQLVDQYMENKLSNYTTEKKVREILDAMYPVGSVYITADKNNPGNFIGGTWEQFGQGRTLIGEGTGNDGSTSMSFTANSVGGEYKHILVISEIPRHTHGLALFDDSGSQEFYSNALSSKWSKSYKEYDNPVYGEGGNKPHNNIQPYTTVYFWMRTK